MSSESATAIAVGCVACGGRFPIARPEPSVVCPFCQQRQALPEALLAELRGFRQQFTAEQVEADTAAQHAEAWREFSRNNRPVGKRTLFVFQLLMLLPIGIAILIAKLAPQWPVSPAAVAITGYAVVVGGLLLLGKVRGARAQGSSTERARRAPARADLGIHEISCPSCGAPNAYDARREDTPCAHCGSALFPTRTVLGQSLDAARAGKRNALLARYRAERAGTAQLALGVRADRSGSFARHKPALFISLAVVGVLGAATQEADARSLPWILPLWLLVPLPFVYTWRRARRDAALKERLEAALALVARQGRGVVDGDVSEYLAWLDRHWAGPHQIPYANLGSWFHTVRLTVASFPALLEVNLDPLEEGTVQALMAAWVPGASDTGAPLRYDALPPAASTFHDRLLQLGWSVEVTSAGLLARMHLATDGPRRLLQHPESATALMEVLAHMAGLGRCLGAV